MLIIGHRGASGRAPENTLAAFELAWQLEVQAIEFDVQLADDELYVFHDTSLERLTQGHGLFKQQSKQQIAALRVKELEPIPTLAQVLEFAFDKFLINIEIKDPQATTLLCQQLPALYKQYAARSDLSFDELISRLLISSFDYPSLEQVHQQLPELQLAFLAKGFTKTTIAKAQAIDAIAINILASKLTELAVQKIHQAGMKCFAYTVNKDNRFKQLKAFEVDGVFSDYPEIFLSHQRSQDLNW